MIVIGKNDSKKLREWKKQIARRNKNNIIELKSGLDTFKTHIPYCNTCGCNSVESFEYGIYCPVCDCYYFK